MNKVPPVLHPFMIASVFVLANFYEVLPFTPLWELAVVLPVVLLLTWVLVRACNLAFRGVPYKGAMLASVFILSFCFFGNYQFGLQQLLKFLSFGGTLRARYMFGGFLFLVALMVWWLMRTRRDLRPVKRYLNWTGTFAVVFTVAKCFYSQFTLPAPSPTPPSTEVPPKLQASQASPDIYYILTDAYTSNESLKQFWGYDNSPFTGFLTNRGFVVVPDAKGNYTSTILCMPASLNMEYPSLPPEWYSEFSDMRWYCKKIHDARVVPQLQSAGYEFINLSLFDMDGRKKYYKSMFFDSGSLVNILLDRTVIGYFRTYFGQLGQGQVNLKIFRRLSELAGEPSQHPRFVYAHLMMPHRPYLFDRHGKPVKDGMKLEPDKNAYLEQLLYVNQLVTNVVSDILTRSKTPPIIVLQGDHGFRYLPDANRSLEAPTILNAYHLPGGRPDWVYQGITPVNSFRMIFNHYFGTHYDYLPDVQLSVTDEPPGPRLKK